MTTPAPPSGAHRLEVWGDPIAHSLSPRLHAAAYAALGWEWTYGRRRVDADAFDGELAGLDSSFRGLSLTSPLKTAAHRAAAWCDRFAELTGAVNTLLLGDRPRGYNTDVPGLVADLRDHGIDGIAQGRIVGAGATATSALVALGALGARRVDVIARRLGAIAPLVELGERIGVSVHPRELERADALAALGPVPVTVSTLPGGAALAPAVAARVAAGGGFLYDVVYGHWPTPLAQEWQAAGEPATNGLGMLLQQAVRQIRIFGAGDPGQALPDEPAVVDVMRRALMGD